MPRQVQRKTEFNPGSTHWPWNGSLSFSFFSNKLLFLFKKNPTVHLLAKRFCYPTRSGSANRWNHVPLPEWIGSVISCRWIPLPLGFCHQTGSGCVLPDPIYLLSDGIGFIIWPYWFCCGAGRCGLKFLLWSNFEACALMRYTAIYSFFHI